MYSNLCLYYLRKVNPFENCYFFLMLLVIQKKLLSTFKTKLIRKLYSQIYDKYVLLSIYKNFSIFWSYYLSIIEKIKENSMKISNTYLNVWIYLHLLNLFFIWITDFMCLCVIFYFLRSILYYLSSFIIIPILLENERNFLR